MHATRVLSGCLAHKEAHPLGPYSTPIYRPAVVLAGRGGLVMSEVSLYPPRPERAPRPCRAVTCRRVRRATCPLPPRRLPRRSPLPRVQGVGFNRSITTPAALHAILNGNPSPGLCTRVRRNKGNTPPLRRSGASGTTGVPYS